MKENLRVLAVVAVVTACIRSIGAGPHTLLDDRSAVGCDAGTTMVKLGVNAAPQCIPTSSSAWAYDWFSMFPIGAPESAPCGFTPGTNQAVTSLPCNGATTLQTFTAANQGCDAGLAVSGVDTNGNVICTPINTGSIITADLGCTKYLDCNYQTTGLGTAFTVDAGTVSLCGINWWGGNLGSGTVVVNADGGGLNFTNIASSTDWYGQTPNRTEPVIETNLTSIDPNISPLSIVCVWVALDALNGAANFDSARWGTTNANTNNTDWAYSKISWPCLNGQCGGGFNSQTGGPAMALYDWAEGAAGGGNSAGADLQVGVAKPSVSDAGVNYNMAVFCTGAYQLVSSTKASWWVGTYNGTSWPTYGQLTHAGSAQTVGAAVSHPDRTTGALWYQGVAGGFDPNFYSMFIGCGRAGSGTTGLQCQYTRVRVDVCQALPIQE